MKKGNTSMKRTLMAINIVALLGLAGFSTYLFMENRDLSDQVNLTNQEKNERLIAEVNEVYDLPDEDPVVGVVRDVDEFKTEFTAFANDDVQVDDRLLFFRKNRLNVLYRPSDKRVVKTYNVTVPIAVEIVGTNEALDQNIGKLDAFGNSVTVTRKTDNNITQAFVFDVDNDQTADTARIAEELGLEVGTTLPNGVTPDSTTEVMIFVVVGEEKPATPPAAEDNE
jgi:hypothetical protein